MVKNLKKPDLVARQKPPFYTTNIIFVKRETVCVALKSLNPKRVALRQAHQFHKRKGVEGLNQLGHIDGKSKLKPFGFSIHGCINVYSRKVIWVEVCFSN